MASTASSEQNRELYEPEMKVRLTFGGITFENVSCIDEVTREIGRGHEEGRKRIERSHAGVKTSDDPMKPMIGVKKTLVFFHTDYFEKYVIPDDFIREVEDLTKKPENEKHVRYLEFSFCHRKMSVFRDRPWPRSISGIQSEESDDFTEGGGFQFLLMTNVINRDFQVCTKLEGTTGNLTLPKSQLTSGNTFTFTKLMWSCPSLREYYPSVSPVKGKMRWVEITLLTVSSFLWFKNSELIDDLKKKGLLTNETVALNQQLMREKRHEQDAVKSFIEHDLTPFFLERGRCIMPEAAQYYRLIYPISTQNVGVYNAYLGHMIHLHSPNLGAQRIHYLFSAALARNPEIHDLTMWKVILDVRFTYDHTKLTEQEIIEAAARSYSKEEIGILLTKMRSMGGDFRYLFIKALDVAVDLLTVYSNAVPYLGDYEHVSDSDYHGGGTKMKPFHQRWEMRKGQRSPKARNAVYSRKGESSESSRNRGDYQTNSLPVERFFNPTTGFGHDCEDGSTYSVYLKCSIQKEYHQAVSSGNVDTVDPLIIYLGRVYKLFNACLMGLYSESCGSPVFHIGTLLVPVWYLYQCKLRGVQQYRHKWKYLKNGADSVQVPWVPKRPEGVTKWEKNPNYIGSFIAEGTCVEEPHKFVAGNIACSQRSKFLMNYGPLVDSIYNNGSPKEMINRVLFERKEYFSDGQNLSSFYVAATAFDHIDYDDNLARQDGTMDYCDYPEKMSFVWYSCQMAEKMNNKGSTTKPKNPYGVFCDDLFQRHKDVGCYPMTIFATPRGRNAFSASMKQMTQNWPPMVPPLLPQKTSLPEHLVDFINMAEKHQGLKPYFSAPIGLYSEFDVPDPSNRGIPHGDANYTRLHFLDSDLQRKTFREGAVAVLYNLIHSTDYSKAPSYYALRLRVNFIQDTAMYPCILEDHKVDAEVTVSVERRPLHQVIALAYYYH